MHEIPSSPTTVTTIFYYSLTEAADYLTSSTKMLYAKYKRTSSADVVHSCDHLTDINKPADLRALLFKFPHLFSSKLGCYVYKMDLSHFPYPPKGWESSLDQWWFPLEQTSTPNSVFSPPYSIYYTEKSSFSFITKLDVSIEFVHLN